MMGVVIESSGWIAASTVNLAQPTSTASRIQEKSALTAVVPIAQRVQNCVAMGSPMAWKTMDKSIVEVRTARSAQLVMTVKSTVKKRGLTVEAPTAILVSVAAIAPMDHRMAWSSTSIVEGQAANLVKP